MLAARNGRLKLTREYKVVNVGSHVNPPPTMWAEYFPEELKDRAPQVVVQEFEPGEGEWEALVVDGIAYRQLDSQQGVKVNGEIFTLETGYSLYSRNFYRGDDGQRYPEARVRAMDMDGIDADVLTHPGYPIIRPSDRTTQWGMMYAYNSWLADFCDFAPDRLLGIGEIPMWDIDLAVSEVHRIAKRGLKGVMVPMIPTYVGAWSSPADKPYTDPFYRPLWEALNETGLVIVVHADAAAATPGLEDFTNAGINMILNKTLPSEMIASLICGHVFRDFPNIKLVCVETGVGWMAHLVRWMDVLLKEHPLLYPGLAEPPSETFHKHVFGSFLWDSVGVRNRDVIGIENIMWCNDYPHNYGPWPNSKDQIDKDLAGISEEDRHAILAGNAVRVFNLGK